jgi:hypothetical protein
MVEHNMHDPQAPSIDEAEFDAPPLPRRGLCLICGVWIDDDERDVYGVTLALGGNDASQHVAHIACLGRVVHPSARLPDAPARAVPDNYLASKFRTPSGR